MSLGYNQQEILHLELNYWLLFCTPCWGLKKRVPGVPQGLSPAIKQSKLHGRFPTQTIKAINTIQTFPKLMD